MTLSSQGQKNKTFFSFTVGIWRPHFQQVTVCESGELLRVGFTLVLEQLLCGDRLYLHNDCQKKEKE